MKLRRLFVDEYGDPQVVWVILAIFAAIYAVLVAVGVLVRLCQ